MRFQLNLENKVRIFKRCRAIHTRRQMTSWKVLTIFTNRYRTLSQAKLTAMKRTDNSKRRKNLTRPRLISKKEKLVKLY